MKRAEHIKDDWNRHCLCPSLSPRTMGLLKDGLHGMTCDFSDAERCGFEQAVRTAFNVPEEEVRVLDVHFKRALTRVQRNAAIAPSAQ